MVSPSTGSRRLGASRVAVVVIVAILLSMVLSIAAIFGSSPAYADGTAVSVTGSHPAWNELNGAPMSHLPTATVSQTENLVDQTVQVSWAHFSPSTNDPYSPTVPVQGIYYGDPGTDLYPVLVLQCRGVNPANDLNSTHPSCYKTAAGRTDGPGGLGNAVYSVTNPDGSGQVSLHVENAQTNSVLGCDATHACSVVVLPAFGGRQDPNAKINCNDHSLDYPTEANGYVSDANTLASDNMFGAACSWANRLVIPLHFATTPSNCPKASPAFSAAGSPMLSRAMQQWQAGWCHGSSALSFDYNSTSNEYQARSSFLNGGGALTSATDVALTTQPGNSSGRKYTYAPIANTDIAVAFVIDNPRTGRIIPDLTLSARLVAKMLTQSYSLQFACTSGGSTTKQSTTCDPAVKGNPSSIFTDPEFVALNPQIKAGDYPSQNLTAGDFLPTVVSGNSDLIWTLTSWIASNPDARAFLAGRSDPWGTHVNTYYRGGSEYPTSQLRELDPGFVDPAAPAGNGTMQNSWQPVNGLDRVGQLLVGNSTSALSNVQNQCGAPPCSFPRVIDQLGARALFAVLDQGTASAYNFPTARLVNAAGRAVAPTTAAVAAGLSSMKTNPDGITQTANFTSAKAAAYPLSVVDYAMLPTCGVARSTAAAIANFLHHVSTSQTSGVRPGTIAPGYLRLSRHQLAQLAAASAAVSSTRCDRGVPQTPRKTTSAADHPSRPAAPTFGAIGHQSSNGTPSGVHAQNAPAPGIGGQGNPQAVHPQPNSNSTGTGTGTGPGTGTGTGAGTGTGIAPGSGVGKGAGLRTGSTAATGAPARANAASNSDAAGPSPTTSPATRLAAYGYKPASGAMATRYLLPGLLVLGALLLLVGPGVFLAFTSGAVAVVRVRARAAYRSLRRRTT